MTVVETPKSRVEQRAHLVSLLEREGLSAVVISSYQALSYFAGTYIMTQVSVPDRLEFLVVQPDGAALLVCNLETSMVREQTDVEEINEYTEFADNPSEALARYLTAAGLTSGRIGIEARRLHAEAADIVRRALPDVELVPVDDAVEELQAVKSRVEADQLEYAAQSTLDAVEGAIAAAAAGVSELDLCADIAGRMMKRGGIFSFMVFGSGRRALGAHVEAIDTPLDAGALWRIDLGARFFDTINSDLARTGVVGDARPDQEEILQALRATQDAGFATLEAGRPASEVFNAVKREFERQKLPFFMPHIGHGLGIGLHEFPMLEPRNDAPLQNGMVLNIEPMVVFPDRGECYHTEDLAVVTPDGPRLLTKPQDRLLRIG
jgi:Xaa-Pro aminopeptidase